MRPPKGPDSPTDKPKVIIDWDAKGPKNPLGDTRAQPALRPPVATPASQPQAPESTAPQWERTPTEPSRPIPPEVADAVADLPKDAFRWNMKPVAPTPAEQKAMTHTDLGATLRWPAPVQAADGTSLNPQEAPLVLQPGEKLLSYETAGHLFQFGRSGRLRRPDGKLPICVRYMPGRPATAQSTATPGSWLIFEDSVAGNDQHVVNNAFCDAEKRQVRAFGLMFNYSDGGLVMRVAQPGVQVALRETSPFESDE
ncbi:hypothetical protein CO046_05585 [Candidatus Peregrinibacteria bacterium CG_4_9_14_0_2_um_filter_53_11]|nr:MAG: hypothetical protein CO046_05585 [Candidatus Peregrinibacteria bacterium CG_4_9_14_0_2_um_filter_53_11]